LWGWDCCGREMEMVRRWIVILEAQGCIIKGYTSAPWCYCITLCEAVILPSYATRYFRKATSKVNKKLDF
jgi:hypothetical protein